MAILIAMTGFASPSYSQMGPSFGDGGPIDIQANEQEFADNHMIARGNVRVTHKDTVIDAPLATLYKDAAGKPQRAVFTGHPRLRQGVNRIDADTLIFEINTQTIIADGNSHSEVAPNDANAVSQNNLKAPLKAPQPQAQSASPDAGLEEEDAQQADAESGGSSKAPAKPKTKEKIVTDADKQVFNRTTGRFEATGHVRVKHGEIFVNSDKLNLVYGSDKRPETAVFTGNVKATQNQNCTEADTMTYFLNTKRLQATGHVRSKVVQEKKADASKKGGLFAGSKEESGTLLAASASKSPDMDIIIIHSDAQDYSEGNGRVTADGNVKLFYQDTIGVAPKIILLRNPQDGRAEKVLMAGRCQITQPGKRWIADRITFTVADSKVLAEGNTRAIILQSPKGPQIEPRPLVADPGRKRLADQPRPRTGAIGSSKIEITR